MSEHEDLAMRLNALLIRAPFASKKGKDDLRRQIRDQRTQDFLAMVLDDQDWDLLTSPLFRSQFRKVLVDTLNGQLHRLPRGGQFGVSADRGDIFYMRLACLAHSTINEQSFAESAGDLGFRGRGLRPFACSDDAELSGLDGGFTEVDASVALAETLSRDWSDMHNDPDLRWFAKFFDRTQDADTTPSHIKSKVQDAVNRLRRADRSAN